MRKLKYERFAGWAPESNLCDFINENNIKQSDVLKIVYEGDTGMVLYYYVIE
ncbi:hypothetical protein [Mucilaginibacter sp.]|uniref:hypothetical protein n=1 Tax=Mucilaginibacter sp. TaxID=1882438 RepID=UPI0035BBF27E